MLLIISTVIDSTWYITAYKSTCSWTIKVESCVNGKVACDLFGIYWENDAYVWLKSKDFDNCGSNCVLKCIRTYIQHLIKANVFLFHDKPACFMVKYSNFKFKAWKLMISLKIVILFFILCTDVSGRPYLHHIVHLLIVTSFKKTEDFSSTAVYFVFYSWCLLIIRTSCSISLIIR